MSALDRRRRRRKRKERSKEKQKKNRQADLFFHDDIIPRSIVTLSDIFTHKTEYQLLIRTILKLIYAATMRGVFLSWFPSLASVCHQSGKPGSQEDRQTENRKPETGTGFFSRKKRRRNPLYY